MKGLGRALNYPRNKKTNLSILPIMLDTSTKFHQNGSNGSRVIKKKTCKIVELKLRPLRYTFYLIDYNNM